MLHKNLLVFNGYYYYFQTDIIGWMGTFSTALSTAQRNEYSPGVADKGRERTAKGGNRLKHNIPGTTAVCHCLLHKRYLRGSPAVFLLPFPCTSFLQSFLSIIPPPLYTTCRRSSPTTISDSATANPRLHP